MSFGDDRRTKQVIVIRKDLGMRKGKMVAQGCHASIAFLTEHIRTQESFNVPESLWLYGIFTKVCVGVDSEEELLRIHQAATDAGLKSYLITDAGLTEFKAPTITCCAIGPDFNDRIDAITGGLTLL